MHQDDLSKRKKKHTLKLITPESHERANMGSVVSDAVDSLPARGPLRSAAKLRRTGWEDLCRCRRHVALRYGGNIELPCHRILRRRPRPERTWPQLVKTGGLSVSIVGCPCPSPAWQSEAGRRRTKTHVYYGPQPCVYPGPNLRSGNFYEIFLTRL